MGARAAIWTVALTVGMVACGGGGEGGGEGPGAESAPADGDMLVVAMGADADALMPQVSTSADASDITDQIFWYLMRSDPDLIHHQPGLADSFRFSEDSLAIDFFIHPGITWHDGERFTADDVVFAHELCLAPEVNFPSVSWLDHITSVEAVDSLTVRFRFDERYLPEYMVTDATVCYPMPEHILGDVPMAEIPNHEFVRRPVGNGPFRFVEWAAGERIVIEANPDFFRGRPHLNRVTYRVIPEPTTIATELQNGSVDLWPRFQSTLYPQISEDARLEVMSEPGRSYTYVTYNIDDPLFADARVRQALTMGLDRQAIVDALLYGQAKIATQPIISIIWAHDPSIDPWPHDPERARRLLEEAGWTDTDGDGIRDKDGRPFRFTLQTNTENTLRLDIAQIAQEQWRQIGIAPEVRSAETNTFYDGLINHDYQAAIAGWVVGIKPDIEPMFGSGEQFNFPGVADGRLDSLIVAAKAEPDMEEAKRLWAEAQRIIVDEAYYTFLFEQNDLNAIAQRFEGVDMTPYGWGHYLEEWYVPEGRQRYDIPVGASPFDDESTRPVAAADTADATGTGR